MGWKAVCFTVFAVCIIAACDAKVAPPPAEETVTYTAVGVVRKVDLETMKITIDHEDIPGYMSAMEMTEKVPDRKIIASLKPGDKVEFELLRHGSDVTFTKFTKVAEVALNRGAEIYRVNCAECHGANGEGAEKGIPLTKGHALHHSESEHIKQVTFGEGEKMPPFKDRLSDDELRAVVKFVREELQKNRKHDDSGKHSH